VSQINSEGKTEKIFVRMTASDRALLEQIAQDEHRHMTQVIEIALHDYATKQGYRQSSRGNWR